MLINVIVGNGVQRVSSAFLTELPQKGMARIFLATQVLHRPINPGFTQCAASRFHALFRQLCVLLNVLPKLLSD
ncbi:hypothetical protein NKH95_01595 [Mesorhizobium sp. M0848]|uniref:hypothetical protein n=1 Tax=Mesorhizobium sp. M0848 TaxID=2957012 RepID=UPI003336A754